MSSLSLVYLDTEVALGQIGDVETMNGMLVMLEESLARDIPLITLSFQSGNVAAANRLLHGIKGFVPIFCRDDFCARVVEVEAMSKDSKSLTASDAYNELRPDLEQLLADVSEYLNVSGGAG